MKDPLLLAGFLEYADRYYPQNEIVSVYTDTACRCTSADFHRRTRQLAGALQFLGIKRGDRAAYFALNNRRHLELYFGFPAIGAVLHTINIRLSLLCIAKIINHAGDRVLFLNEDVHILIKPIKDQLKRIEHRDFHPEYTFPLERDENEPAPICYTSATLGDPQTSVGKVNEKQLRANVLPGMNANRRED